MKRIQYVLLTIFILCCIVDHVSAQLNPVSSYQFTTANSNYTQLGGTNSTATGDDGTQNGIPIGFNFTFGGTVYTHFCISTNGFIKLGNASSTIGVNDYINNISNSNTFSPVIAAFWDDNNRYTGTISYATTLSGSFKELTVDWNDVNIGGDGIASGVNLASFQIKIFEVNNSIRLIYANGNFNAAGTLSGSIGLNDNTSFLSVSPYTGSGNSTSVSSTIANNNISNITFVRGLQYTFTPPPPVSTCPPPDYLIATATTTSTLTVKCRSVSGAAGYQYAYSTTSTPPASGTFSTDTSFTFTGLTQGTGYYYFVRTQCAGGDFSVWLAGDPPVSTNCSITTVPYTQNFDAAVTPAFPVCTSTQSEQGNGAWLMSTTNPRSSPNCIQIVSDATQIESDWFYTGPMALTGGVNYRVSFYYKSGNANQGYLNLLLQDVNNLNNNLVFGGEYFITNTNYQLSVAHFTPTITGTYKIGFRGLSQNTLIDLSLDDITIEPTPVCGEPTNLSVDFTTLTAATFSWTAPAQGTPVGYGYMYTTSATPPLNGWFTTNTSESFNGLVPGVQYYLHVKSECQYGIFSNWVTIPFKTPCLARSVPYMENFDGVTAPSLPDCIEKQDRNAGTTWNTSTTGSRSAPNSMRYNFDAALPANDWFYTAPVKLNGGSSYRISFYYKARNATFPEKLEVKYGNRNNATAMTTLLFSNSNITNTTYQLSATDFTPATTDSFYVGFHAFSIADRYDLNVDDISINVTPICGSPTNLAVNFLSANTGTASWSASGVGSIAGYQYAVTSSAAAPLTGTSTGNTSAPISGFAPGPQYYLHVKTSCSAGIFSQWATLPFTVPCGAYSIPYTENFDSVVNFPSLPPCMTVQDLNGAATWVVDHSDPFTAPNSMSYLYDATLPADDWFYTPPLSVTAGTKYRLSFYYKAAVSVYPERLEVKYGNANTASGMTNLLFNNSNIINTNYLLSETDFTASTTGNIYIGFHAYSLADQLMLNVDDIKVDFASDCGPALNTVIKLTSDTSGTATWSTPVTGTPTGYEYIISTSHTIPLTAGTIITDTSITFSGLASYTQYYLHARTKCGNNASLWRSYPFATVLNDSVCSATTLVLGGPEQCGNTTLATAVADPPFACSTPNNTVWYKYTPAVTGKVSLRITIPALITNGLAGWIGWYTATGNCPSSLVLTEVPGVNCIVFGASGSGTSDTLTSPVLTAGITYYIMADGFEGSYGAYCLNLVPPPPPPSCTTNIYPANAATGIVNQPTGVQLKWSKANGATSYDLFIRSANSTLTQVVGIVDTFYVRNGLNYDSTYYWYVVPKNDGGNAAGCSVNTTSFTMIPTPANCLPLTTYGCTDADSITFFSLKGEPGTSIINNSADSCTAAGYTDYSSTFSPPVLAAGNAYSGFIRTGYPLDYASIWIDYNNNGFFEDVERVLNNLLIGLTKTLYAVYIPANAATGIHKMRVRVTYYAATPATPTNPCNHYNYGETEDYSVNITGSTAALRSVAAGTINSCERVSSTTIDAASNNNNGTAIPVLDSNNNYVAFIYPDGNNLGAVKASIYINADSIRQTNGTFYLDRSITLTPQKQPAGTYRLRFFYKTAELNRMIAEPGSGVNAPSDLLMTKVKKDTCGGAIAGTISTDTTYGQVGTGAYNGDRFIDFSGLKSFSTYYLNSFNIYTFTGNGNWSNAGNWKNGIKPPALLPLGGRVIIDHAIGGQCILDIIQHISTAGSITIITGKNLVIPGLMMIQ
ncbi:MAG: fibronectin type III domain-containing protein [Chitinophagaceae bacterium]|nr:fibronectin type III domain-containing protein [Chitinophagaceae bacterium]